MGLELSADVSPIELTYADMIQQLADLPEKMGTEMMAWQKDDMKRRYPNMTMPDAHSVQTMIWPRSRLTTTQRYAIRMPGRPKGAKTMNIGGKPRGFVKVSRNPTILRPELFDMLDARMVALLEAVD